MKQKWQDMIYMTACALNGVVPKAERVEQMETEELFSVAEAHSLVGVVAAALEAAGGVLAGKWLQAKEKAVRKSILMDAEYDRVAAYLEEQGIWYMPLKGRILQDFYPKKGMRQMADTDILFDASYRSLVHDFFVGNGYKTELYENGNHDVYLKAPVYNFEMHIGLYGIAHKEEWNRYYKAVKERLVKTEGKNFEYRFTDEDFYVYFLSHAYKHYSFGGTGLRTMADQYVYLKAKEACLDWDYVYAELEKLGLTGYEKETAKLCKKLFSMERESSLDEKEQKEVAYYLSSSTHGSTEHYITNKVNELEKKSEGKHTKMVYWKERLFPDKETLQVYCPAAKKYKGLLLYAWVKRLFQAIFCKHKEIKKEWDIVNDTLQKNNCK